MDPFSALGDVLGKGLGGLPLWGWVALVGGAVVVVWVGRKYFGNKGSVASDGGSTGTGTSNAALDPNIDPNTGVPYSIESQINPNTGLPAYYGGAGVTNQSAPPGQWDLSQLITALQQYQQSTNSQQNPSGPGGIPMPGPGQLPVGDVGGWSWDSTQNKWVFSHGNMAPPPGGWGPPPPPPQNPATVSTINAQTHAPVLSNGTGNPGDTSGGTVVTGQPPQPTTVEMPPPPPPPPAISNPAYRLAGSTTVNPGTVVETGQRTVQATAVRPGIRAQ